MFDGAGAMFFKALCQVAERRLGRGHPCLAAIAAAAESGNPDTTRAAQEALGALDPDVAAALMADAHKVLRENPAALLDAWRGTGARH